MTLRHAHVQTACAGQTAASYRKPSCIKQQLHALQQVLVI
jgi:hypothetical protein